MSFYNIINILVGKDNNDIKSNHLFFQFKREETAVISV